MHKVRRQLVVGLSTIALGTLLVVQAHCQQSYLDGFVTAVTAHGFHSGASAVLVTGSTKCFQVSFKHKEKNPLPCAILGLSIGSHLQVTGVKEAAGSIEAKEIASVPPSQDARFENGKSGGPSAKEFRGGAFLEESPGKIGSGSGSDDSVLWINGVQLEISPTTAIHVVAGGLTRQDLWEQDIGSGYISVYSRERTESAGTQSNLVPGVYVSYQAVGRANELPVAISLNIFSSFDGKSKRRSLDLDQPKIHEPDYVHDTPGTIELSHGTRIEILADRSIQEYVRQLGRHVTPTYAHQRTPYAATAVPRFYVVRPFKIRKGDGVDAIDGMLHDRCMARSPINPLEIPSFRGESHQVSELPNGIVLISETALSSLRNEAQLEFLLSVAAESITQRQPFLIGTKFSVGQMGEFTAPSALAQNQRMIRMGIHREFLAGYDIRESPFAFAAQLGIDADNPLVSASSDEWMWPGPGTDTEGTNPDIFPWYVVYGFAYINRYYPDADYSKLKRDEKEYAQFLEYLRRSEPEAFANRN